MDCTAVTHAHGEVANIGLVHVSHIVMGSRSPFSSFTRSTPPLPFSSNLFHFAAHAVDISILLAHILGDAQLHALEDRNLSWFGSPIFSKLPGVVVVLRVLLNVTFDCHDRLPIAEQGLHGELIDPALLLLCASEDRRLGVFCEQVFQFGQGWFHTQTMLSFPGRLCEAVISSAWQCAAAPESSHVVCLCIATSYATRSRLHCLAKTGKCHGRMDPIPGMLVSVTQEKQDRNPFCSVPNRKQQLKLRAIQAKKTRQQPQGRMLA